MELITEKSDKNATWKMILGILDPRVTSCDTELWDIILDKEQKLGRLSVIDTGLVIKLYIHLSL